MKKYFYILSLLLISSSLLATDCPDYGDESNPDFLSPDYYNAGESDSIRLAINEIISLTREETLHHPLMGESLPTYSIFRDFCDVVGRNNNYQYHPARDFYVENRATEVGIYAAHDGIIDTGTTVAKYRHHISITKPILDEEGSEIAKLTTVYAHVDLDLTTIALKDGDTVKRGDLICSHLYSGTMGGPHLHFEIRFYNKEALGTEEFYGWTFSTPSAGPWEYGKWNTAIGIAYGNPDHYLNTENTAIYEESIHTLPIYPNPTIGELNLPVEFSQIKGDVKLYRLNGNISQGFGALDSKSKLDLSAYPDGYYLINFETIDGKSYSYRVLKKR